MTSSEFLTFQIKVMRGFFYHLHFQRWTQISESTNDMKMSLKPKHRTKNRIKPQNCKPIRMHLIVPNKCIPWRFTAEWYAFILYSPPVMIKLIPSAKVPNNSLSVFVCQIKVVPRAYTFGQSIQSHITRYLHTLPEPRIPSG